MNNQEQTFNNFRQSLGELRSEGVSDEMLVHWMRKSGLADYMAGKPNDAMSQTDGVTIHQSEPDAEGFYQHYDSVQQDMFAEAIKQGADVTPRYTESSFFSDGGYSAASGLSMDMNNPNYTVKQDGQRTTVNASGHIVHY